jgi:transposase
MEADGPEAKVLLADRGYDSDHINVGGKGRGDRHSDTPNRKVQIPVDGHICALRNRIERCFNKLKNSRRLATRTTKPQPVISASSISPQSGYGSAHLSTGPS